jgi:EpsD family peptidyl-prolyl cis-trans isomerase
VFALKTTVALVASALALSACGDRPAEKAPASQVVARVNSGEISVHQVNFVLQRSPGIPPEQLPAAKQKVLEILVDQELAVQEALAAKLERTPAVMETLEAARREVLARAYVEQATAKKGKPTAEEIKKFYADRPDLFANRKIYRLEEVVFAASPAAMASVKEQLGKGRPTAEILASLKAAGVEAAGAVSVKPAEQLSMDLLPKLAQVKEGQPQLLESGDRAAIVTVLATKSEPVDEAKAMPFIESYLTKQRQTDLARDTIKELRAKAKIEYAGEFAGTQPAATQAAAEAAPAAKTAPSGTEAAVTKGIAGLK